DGTLRLGADNAAAGAGRSITVAAGTLDLNSFAQSAANLTFGDGAATSSASVIGPGTLNLSGNITFNGNFDLTTPSATIAANVQLSAGGHTLNNVDLNFSANFYDLVISGAISGPGGINKMGNFYVALASANTYGGAT